MKKLFKNKKRKYPKFIIFVTIIMTFFIMPGYAYICSNLGIDTLTLARKNNYDVSIENIKLSNSSSYKLENHNNNNGFDFNVTFNQNTDKYIIEFDAVNNGTLAAYISDINLFDERSDKEKLILDYKYYYNDGTQVELYDKIPAKQQIHIYLEIKMKKRFANDFYEDINNINYSIGLKFKYITNRNVPIYVGDEEEPVEYIDLRNNTIDLTNNYGKKIFSCYNAKIKRNGDIATIEINNEYTDYEKEIYDFEDEEKYEREKLRYNSCVFSDEFNDYASDIVVLDDVEINNQRAVFYNKMKIDLNGKKVKFVNSEYVGIFRGYSYYDKDLLKIEINDSVGSGEIDVDTSLVRATSGKVIINGGKYIKRGNGVLFGGNWESYGCARYYVKNVNIILIEDSAFNVIMLDLDDSTITSNSNSPVFFTYKESITAILANSFNSRIKITNTNINSNTHIFNHAKESNIFICNSTLNSQEEEFEDIYGNVMYSENTIFSNQLPRVKKQNDNYGLVKSNIACEVDKLR